MPSNIDPPPGSPASPGSPGSPGIPDLPRLYRAGAAVLKRRCERPTTGRRAITLQPEEQAAGLTLYTATTTVTAAGPEAAMTAPQTLLLHPDVALTLDLAGWGARALRSNQLRLLQALLPLAETHTQLPALIREAITDHQEEDGLQDNDDLHEKDDLQNDAPALLALGTAGEPLGASGVALTHAPYLTLIGRLLLSQGAPTLLSKEKAELLRTLATLNRQRETLLDQLKLTS